jgi:ribosomal protein S21
MATNVTVNVRAGEHVDRALKRFKSKLDKEGIIDIVRYKRGHETAAQVKKRKAKKLSKTWKFIKASIQNNTSN